jgi:hypothetical protein
VLSSKSGIKAVDVLMSVHGTPTEIKLADGDIKMSTLKTNILNAGVKNLRALYTTACYGADHNAEWIAAGFKVSAGAKAVNCNSGTEYPFFVAKWILGWTYEKALAPENDLVDQAQDALAKAAGFSDPDSTKKIKGDKDLKITTI